MGVKEAIGGAPQAGPPPGGNGRRRFRRNRLAGLPVLVAIVAIGVAAGLGGTLGARADTVNNQDFCLQGDVTNPGSSSSPVICATGQKDWTNFFDSNGNKLTLPTGTNGVFTDSDFQPDAALPDTTTFATGSKDTLPIHTNNGWQCSTAHNLGAKVDLQNTYATVERLNADGHVILYYGAEIAGANGDHNQGMWLLQDPSVGCDGSNGTTTFSGDHTNGDLLFAVELTGGGMKPFSASTVAFEWQCTNDPVTHRCPVTAPGKLVNLNNGNPIGSICGTSPVDEACAITNESWNVTTPWTPGSTTPLGPQQFFEGGIDITEVFGGTAPCFSRFLTDTRSSQSDTATLFDYTQGNLSTCVTPTVSTQLKVQSGSSQSSGDTNVTSAGVVIGSKVYDTSSLTGTLGTPGGTVTYKLYANNDCTGTVPSTALNGTSLTSNTVSSGNVSGTTMPNSSTLTFTATGTYYWVAYYNGDGTNLANQSACAAEPVTINQATPTFTTAQSFIPNDSATLSGIVAGGSGSPTIDFKLFGPTDTSCSGTAIHDWSVPVTGNGTYSTNNTTVSVDTAGTYRWTVTYSGDTYNSQVIQTCGTEQFTLAITNG